MEGIKTPKVRELCFQLNCCSHPSYVPAWPRYRWRPQVKQCQQHTHARRHKCYYLCTHMHAHAHARSPPPPPPPPLSVIYHHGKKATGGHYTCDVYHPTCGGWVRTDDSIVRSVTEDSVLKQGHGKVAYILFYRRLDSITS